MNFHILVENPELEINIAGKLVWLKIEIKTSAVHPLKWPNLICLEIFATVKCIDIY